MFSYHQFKQKLIYKCEFLGKKLYIVNEAFTSKTCCRCGILNDMEGSEVYECHGSHYDERNQLENSPFRIDRDVNGAFNIFTKSLSSFS